MFYSAVVVILLIHIFDTCSEPIKNGKDVGGIKISSGQGYKVTGQEKFPFMVHLEIIGEHKEKSGTLTLGKCGGVIISENAVLTAGHCISGFMRKPQISITAGIVDLVYERGSGQIRKMKDYVIHGGHSDECFHNEKMLIVFLSDIAIVFLDSPFQFGPTVQKAILSDSTTGPTTRQQGLVLGWGTGDKSMLQKIRMTAVSYLDCQKLFKKLIIQDDTFCAISDSNESGPCHGDSGGPFLMNDGKVYGIGSFQQCSPGDGINTPDWCQPTMYTNIGDYYQWIQEELENYGSPISRKDTKRRNIDHQKPSGSGKKAKKS